MGQKKQLFIKAVHISTMWTQTKWSWALWLTNEKASYVAKEDSICLLSAAKEATLNEQWIKPGVPLLILACSDPVLVIPKKKIVENLILDRLK